MLADVLTVSVAVPDPFVGGVIEVGLTEHVMPFVPQFPDMVSPTPELKPFNDVIVMVEVGDAATPSVALSVVGFAEMEKSLPGLTVRVTFVA